MLATQVLALLEGLFAAANGAKDHPHLARGALAVQSRPVSDYLATKASLQQSFAQTDPSSFALNYIQSIAPRWAYLQANPALTAPLGSLSALDAQVKQESRASGQPGGDLAVPIGGVFKNAYLQYDFHLDYNAGVRAANGSRILMRDLIDATVGGNLDLLNRLTDSAARSADTVLALRTFDNTVIRLLAAERAAAITGKRMADVLTLYRHEGDASVYASFDSVIAGVPSDVTAFETFLGAIFLPDLTNLVWVGDPTNGDLRNRDENGLKEYALVRTFYANTQGLDSLGGIYSHNDTSPNPRPWAEVFAEVSNGTWSDGGVGTAVSGLEDGAQRWAHAMSVMTVQNPFPARNGQAPPALLIAPADPVWLLALILAEGAALHEKFAYLADENGRIGTARMSPGLTYVRYNCQQVGGLVNLCGIALAAAASAQVNKKQRYAPVCTAVNADPGLLSLIKDVYADAKTQLRTQITLDEWRKMGQSHAPADNQKIVFEARLRNWLANADNLALLSDFIETANNQDWPSWGEHRSNLSRYRLLRRYYTLVFGDYIPRPSRVPALP